MKDRECSYAASHISCTSGFYICFGNRVNIFYETLKFCSVVRVKPELGRPSSINSLSVLLAALGCYINDPLLFHTHTIDHGSGTSTEGFLFKHL